MEKILVAGGSHAELPLIEALQNEGYFVITTGNNQGALGHQAADLYIKGDFSDKEFIYSLAKEQKVKGIVSGCNDFSYLSVAYACERLGFLGHDVPKTADIIHHKDCFRKLLEELHLPAPKSACITSETNIKNICEQLGFPLLIKPVDLTGGKGIKICYTYEETINACQNAQRMTRQKHILAEQMIEGENHGVSVLLKSQKVVFAFFDNEEYYLNKYLVSGAYAPSTLSQSVKNDVVSQIEKIAGHLQLTDGLFHCQCIMTKKGVTYLIDPCRRTPGDLYVKLVEYVTGIKYSAAIVRAELGLDFDHLLVQQSAKQRCIARECIMTDKTGIFKEIQLDSTLEQYICDRLIWAESGDIIQDYMTYKAGILFFDFPDQYTMKNILKELYQKITIICQ